MKYNRLSLWALVLIIAVPVLIASTFFLDDVFSQISTAVIISIAILILILAVIFSFISLRQINTSREKGKFLSTIIILIPIFLCAYLIWGFYTMCACFPSVDKGGELRAPEVPGL